MEPEMNNEMEQQQQPGTRSADSAKHEHDNGHGQGSHDTEDMSLSLSSPSPPSSASASMSTSLPNYPASTSSRKRTHSRKSGELRRTTLYRPAPFTDEYEAQLARDRTDYSIKFTIEMAKSGKASRPVRIYADGIYDVFHQGHARQLMQAKNLFPNVYLIVGVCSDELTHARKGCTVMTDSERYEAVRHCRYVDEVLRDAPWVTDMEFLTRNKIDFVAHDEEPYTTGTEDDCYAYLKEKGMFVPTVRTDGISTSDIVARIVKDYDVYVRRNLARGYSAKDLNVGFIKEKTFKLQNKMDSLRETGKRVLDNLDERRSDIIHKWEDKSREFIHSFLLLFGKEGRMSQMWNESRGKILKALSPPGSPSRDLHENGSSEEDDDSESEIEPKRRRVQKTSDYSDDEDLLEYDSEINSRKSTKIAK